MIEAMDEPEITIERVFLWQEISEYFRANAFIAGIQDLHRMKDEQRLILAGNLAPALHVELWAKWLGGVGIHEVTIVYNDPSTRGNDFEYEITDSYLRQYAHDPTPLDQADIRDLRTELSEVIWDASKSEYAARNDFLYS